MSRGRAFAIVLVVALSLLTIAHAGYVASAVALGVAIAVDVALYWAHCAQARAEERPRGHRPPRPLPPRHRPTPFDGPSTVTQ